MAPVGPKKKSRRDDVLESLDMMEDGEAPLEDEDIAEIEPLQKELPPAPEPEVAAPKEDLAGPTRRATGMLLCADTSGKGAKVLLLKSASSGEWSLPHAPSLESNQPGEIALRRVVEESAGLNVETVPVCHLLSREGEADIGQHSVFLLRKGDGKEAENEMKGGQSKFFDIQKLPENTTDEVSNCVLLVKDAASAALVGWTAPFNGQAGEWKIDWETLRGLFWHCEGENRYFFEWDQTTGTLFEIVGVEGQRHPVWCLSEPETNKEIWASIPVPPTDPGSAKEDTPEGPQPVQTGAEKLIAKLSAPLPVTASSASAGEKAQSVSRSASAMVGPEGGKADEQSNGRAAKKSRKAEVLNSLGTMEDAEGPPKSEVLMDPDDDDEVDWLSGESDMSALLGINEQEKIELPSAPPEEERKPSAADLDMDMFGDLLEDNDAQDSEAPSVLGPQRPMNLAFQGWADDLEETQPDAKKSVTSSSASGSVSAPSDPAKGTGTAADTATVGETSGSAGSSMSLPMAPPKSSPQKSKKPKPAVPAFTF